MALVEMDFEPRFCRARKYPVRLKTLKTAAMAVSCQLQTKTMTVDVARTGFAWKAKGNKAPQKHFGGAFFTHKFGVYLGVRTCELILCFVAIVSVRVYYVDFFVFFVLRHLWVSQVLTSTQSQNSTGNFARKKNLTDMPRNLDGKLIKWFVTKKKYASSCANRIVKTKNW